MFEGDVLEKTYMYVEEVGYSAISRMIGDLVRDTVSGRMRRI